MKSNSPFTLCLFVMIMAQSCSDIDPVEIPISLDIPGKFTYASDTEIHVLENINFLITNNCQNRPNLYKSDAQWILSGSKILYKASNGCPQGGIHILDPSTGKNELIIDEGNKGVWHDVAGNLINQRIAVIGQKMLGVYEYDGLSVQKIDSTPINLSGSLSLSPDGATVVISHEHLYIFHIGKDSLIVPSGDFFNSKIVSWSNTSDQFVFDGSFDIYFCNDDGNAVMNLTNTPDAHESSPAWSPITDEIVFVRSFPNKNHAEIVLYDLKQNAGDVIFRHDDLIDIKGLQRSQDGSKIAFYNKAVFNDGMYDGIYVIDRSGSALTRYTDRGWKFDWIYP